MTTPLLAALQRVPREPQRPGADWLTAAELAAALGVDESTARRRIRQLERNGVQVERRHVARPRFGGHVVYYNLATPFSSERIGD